jgi:hypothetical protein
MQVGRIHGTEILATVRHEEPTRGPVPHPARLSSAGRAVSGWSRRLASDGLFRLAISLSTRPAAGLTPPPEDHPIVIEPAIGKWIARLFDGPFRGARAVRIVRPDPGLGRRTGAG